MESAAADEREFALVAFVVVGWRDWMALAGLWPTADRILNIAVLGRSVL